eukprot:4435897-Amphidinium_carterae.1
MRKNIANHTCADHFWAAPSRLACGLQLQHFCIKTTNNLNTHRRSLCSSQLLQKVNTKTLLRTSVKKHPKPLRKSSYYVIAPKGFETREPRSWDIASG